MTRLYNFENGRQTGFCQSVSSLRLLENADILIQLFSVLVLYCALCVYWPL